MYFITYHRRGLLANMHAISHNNHNDRDGKHR